MCVQELLRTSSVVTINCAFSLTLLIWHTHADVSFTTSEGFLSTRATQVLFQSFVFFTATGSWQVHFWAPFNAAVCLLFNLSKFSHTAPFLQWIQLAAHIRFNTLMLAYNAKRKTSTLLPQNTKVMHQGSSLFWHLSAGLVLDLT